MDGMDTSSLRTWFKLFFLSQTRHRIRRGEVVVAVHVVIGQDSSLYDVPELTIQHPWFTLSSEGAILFGNNTTFQRVLISISSSHDTAVLLPLLR